MNKTSKWIFIGLMVASALVFVILYFTSTKEDKASPSATTTLITNELELKVTYNQPSKKGRVIFGGLVPYGKVWRTGANEATVFETKTDIVIGNRPLKAGKYSLWTIPDSTQWTVIFNSKMYPWGVDFNEEPLREPAFDALTLVVPVIKDKEIHENFTIQLEESDPAYLSLKWDEILIKVAIKKQ